jgi:uncharacterized integral membrane protein
VGLGYLVVAAVAAAIAVFALQNSEPTDVRFLFWVVERVPVSAVILASLAAGLLAIGLPFSIQRWRLRARARALEARVESLEAALAKRTEPPAPAGRG